MQMDKNHVKCCHEKSRFGSGDQITEHRWITHAQLQPNVMKQNGGLQFNADRSRSYTSSLDNVCWDYVAIGTPYFQPVDSWWRHLSNMRKDQFCLRLQTICWEDRTAVKSGYSGRDYLSQSHPPIFLWSIKFRFLCQQKPFSNLCTKYVLQIHLLGEIICRIVYLLCWHL